MKRRMSLRKRREIRRLLGYGTNPLRRRVRTVLGRDQVHRVGDFTLRLPPEHDLPFYQRRDPTYDVYAIPLLGELLGRVDRSVVIDIGANVGDTALAVLSATPTVRVISVEGSPRFAGYLRDNLAPHGERATVVERFVGPIGSTVTYLQGATTGRFGTAPQQDSAPAVEWIAPDDLLGMADDDEVVVWKSDIDGFDIHVLATHWDIIDARCDVIWFEYDPPGTLGDRTDVDRLIERLATSGRTLWVYDNLGLRMLTIPADSDVRTALSSLTDWLYAQRSGHVGVLFVDIWAVR